MEKNFSLEEIVWAKIGGYPWWPGYIKSIELDKVYEIVFFGDFSRAFLNEKKMQKFEDIKKDRGEKKKLNDAYNIALKVKNGETSIQEEIQKYENNKNFRMKMAKTNYKKKKIKKISIKKKDKELNLKRRYSKNLDSDKNLDLQDIKLSKKRVKSMMLTSKNNLIPNIPINNKKKEILKNLNKELEDIYRTIKRDNSKVEDIEPKISNFLLDILKIDESTIYCSNLGLTFLALQKTVSEKEKEEEKYKKLAKIIKVGKNLITDRLLNGFFDYTHEEHFNNLLNIKKEEKKIKKKTEEIEIEKTQKKNPIKSEDKINLNLKNNKQFQMEKKTQKVHKINTEEEETNISTQNLDINKRILFRVQKKITKIIFLNGGKTKISKKKCQNFADKIENFIRKNSKCIRDYKEKIHKIVKYFDKKPDNVYDYIIKYCKANNNLSFLTKLEKLINN